LIGLWIIIRRRWGILSSHDDVIVAVVNAAPTGLRREDGPTSWIFTTIHRLTAQKVAFEFPGPCGS
jgi:hypothetical protein